MKYFTISMIAAAFLAFTAPALAGGMPELVIRSDGSKTFVLHLANTKGGQVTINLLDESQKLLFCDESDGKQPFSKKYNLSDLPNGDYLLELEYQTSIKLQPIRVSGNFVLIDPSLQKTLFKPVFAAGNGYVDITYLQVADTTAHLEVMDAASQSRHEERFGQIGSIRRRLDTSRLEPGQYQLRFWASGRAWHYDFLVGR